MKRDEAARQALVNEIVTQLDVLRRAGDQLDEAVALQFGLNRTDLRCLGILYRHGRVTAGELAEESGLTTGAITTVLDRLEKNGYANRVPDPADRRRVVVVSTAAAREIGARLYGEVEVANRGVLEERSPQELEAIRDFLRRTREVYESQIADITVEAAPGAESKPAMLALGLVIDVGGKAQTRESFAPLGDVREARLEFTKGAAKVRLAGDPALDDLYRASFGGPVPEIKVEGGAVTVQQRRRFRPLDWRTQSADFKLSTQVPWSISLRGGVWKLKADLRAVRVTGFEILGGVADVDVTLSAPVGTVPVRVAGGAGDVTIRRPKGTEARAEVSGGVGQLIFDGQALGTVGGRRALESAGYAEAADRYEIRFSGGASQVSVATY